MVCIGQDRGFGRGRRPRSATYQRYGVRGYFTLGLLFNGYITSQDLERTAWHLGLVQRLAEV